MFHGGGLNQRLDTQNAQERAAYEPEEHIVAEEKVRYEREAEGSHEPVNCVSGRRSHTGKKPGPPAEYERATSAEDADGADRGRDDKADDESLEKKSRFHVEKIAAILPRRDYFDNGIFNVSSKVV